MLFLEFHNLISTQTALKSENKIKIMPNYNLLMKFILKLCLDLLFNDDSKKDSFLIQVDRFVDQFWSVLVRNQFWSVLVFSEMRTPAMKAVSYRLLPKETDFIPKIKFKWIEFDMQQKLGLMQVIHSYFIGIGVTFECVHGQ